ncbi:MAG: DUF4249 family protein [Bacteroidetes bacterium]|nr:DUF4249 family protein [Bacteroidota bacterium]
MKKIIFHIILYTSLFSSCVTPREIDILRDITWTVFGLVGEDKAPVIFVYAKSEDGGFIYNNEAEIVLEEQNSGALIRLTPVIAENEAFLGTREFPFDQDWAGNIYYFTSPGYQPLPASNYKVRIKLEEQIGIADISFPSVESFTNVSLHRQTNQEGQVIDRLKMKMNGIGVDQLVKWEIAIDQLINIVAPTAYDSVSGDPIDHDTLSFPFLAEITPKNYITAEKVTQNDGVFNYKLSGNLPSYENNQSPYILNVRLRNYSDALVSYFESVIDQQAGTIFNPFIEPVTIESNIEGLFGVIGTYSYSQDYILEYLP